MKKICFIIVVLFGVTNVFGQHQVNSFFDDMGIVRLETQELSEAADTIISVFHRADDVVWSRTVYRIIDMRFKQNYQLYYPFSSEEPTYRSLFFVMLKAIENGMPIYGKVQNDIKPYFNQSPLAPEDIPNLLKIDADVQNAVKTDSTANDIAKSAYMLLNYDSITKKMSFNNYTYDKFVRNQLKFMIQEVVFFDKHYSRLYSKILAIAPLHSGLVTYDEDMKLKAALWSQILFWVPFDSFRPYMAQQYIMPNKNDTKRITFDDFFTEKRYTSYIVGASNIYDRMIPDYATTREEIEREQQLIENELLNFELDLWEY